MWRKKKARGEHGIIGGGRKRWPTFRFTGCRPIFPEDRQRGGQISGTIPGYIAKVNLSYYAAVAPRVIHRRQREMHNGGTIIARGMIHVTTFSFTESVDRTKDDLQSRKRAREEQTLVRAFPR